MNHDTALIHELHGGSIGPNGQPTVAGVGPVAPIARDLGAEFPWRTAAARQSVVDPIHHLVEENVIVPEEEDLNAELSHQRVHRCLLADPRRPRTAAPV